MSGTVENQGGHPAYGKKRPEYREHAPRANRRILCEEARVRTGLRELLSRRTNPI